MKISTVTWLILFCTLAVTKGDVIFTTERCDRVLYGLQIVKGDPARYKQCGPSGRVWIVPCAPGFTFDPEDRLCQDRGGKQYHSRKQSGLVKNIITTPAPSPTPQRAEEEFVFSTIRPKRPRNRTKSARGKATWKTTLQPSTTPLPTSNEEPDVKSSVEMVQYTASAEETTTVTNMIQYQGRTMTEQDFFAQILNFLKTKKTASSEDVDVEKLRKEKEYQIERQRQLLQEEERLRELERLRKIEEERLEEVKRRREEEERAEEMERQREAEKEREELLRQESERRQMEKQRELEKFKKAQAEIETRRREKEMEELQIQQQRRLEEEERRRYEMAKQQEEERKRQEMLKNELEEKRRIEMERKAAAERKRIEENERREAEERRLEERVREEAAEKQRLETEMREAEERRQALERHRQEQLRREAEVKRLEEEAEKQRRAVEKKRIEEENQRKEEIARKEAEEAYRLIEEERKKQEMLEQEAIERQRQEEEERVRLERLRKEEEERNRTLEVERAARVKAEMDELARREQEDRLRKAQEMAEWQLIEQREKERSAKIAEIEKSQRFSQLNPDQNSIIERIVVPDMRYTGDIEGQMIRFTTPVPEWRERETDPQVYHNCQVNGECTLSYDHDTLCEHPSSPTLYLQCAPLRGRFGIWTERMCPGTLTFIPKLARCDKEKTPYNPDGRVIIPRLPTETNFARWQGNREIQPPSQPTSRVYPPEPEQPLSGIMNTIGQIPQELLAGPNRALPYPTMPADLMEQHKFIAQIPIVEQSLPAQINVDTNEIHDVDADLSRVHPLFPRVQPSFLRNFIPDLSQKMNDEPKEDKEEKKTEKQPGYLGRVLKPVVKQIAMDQTEMLIDRLLEDQTIPEAEEVVPDATEGYPDEFI